MSHNERDIAYFSNLISQYGADVRAVDWGSRESQELRFALLAEVGDLRQHSILDVGCGQGDLFNWLLQRNAEVTYTGIDVTPGMIDIARRRFPDGRFLIGDLLAPASSENAKFDFVVASGIFYHRTTEPYCYMRSMVEAMFARCTRAAAFNTLSAWATDPAPEEFYADPGIVLKLCQTVTPWVALRHDYHRRDFTVYLYQERRHS